LVDYNIKKILVPFDFTHGALNALKMADKFANEFNATIHLVNIINPINSTDEDYFENVFNGNNIKNSYDRVENYINFHSINPSAYSFSIEKGSCLNTINNLVKNENYDLIILNENSNNSCNSKTAHYDTLKIMESTHLPVIVVNKYYRVLDFKNVICPIRSVPNWYDKLPFIVSLAKQAGSKIHLVGIDDENLTTSHQFNLILDEALAVLANQNVLSSVNIFRGSNSFIKLRDLSQSLKASLLAITPPKKQIMVKSLFKPSLYIQFLSNPPAPIFGVNLA
jgi:hypothetical protein